MVSFKGWPTTSLGEVCDVRDGPFGSKLKTAHYSKDGARVIRLQNIEANKFLDEDKVFVPLRYYDELKEHDARHGDIIVASLGDYPRPAGRACVLPKLSSPAIVKADCFRVRPNTDKLDPNFLCYFMNSDFGRSQVDALLMGATRPRLTVANLRTLRVPIPPLDEQKRIVKRLEAQFSTFKGIRIRLTARINQTKALRDSVFLNAFCGIRPLSVDAEDEQTPQGWRWASLGDLAQLESGHTPSRHRQEWWGGDIPWIALPDIRAADGKELMETAETTNALGLANSSARLLPKGTVVMSRTASVGFVTVMGRAMATSQDFVNWICEPELDPWFLAWALIASRSYLLDLASGAIHKTIYMPTVESFRLCVPGIEEQRRIVASLRGKLARIDSAIASLETEKAQAELLQPALLRAAFSGQL
jgi:type I restriction enzyme, S subunit